MGKTLTVVTSNGTVNVFSVCKLVFLLILSSLAFVAALAVNETVQKIIEKYVIRKDSIWGYLVYSLVAISLVIIMAYVGCQLSPELVEYINLSPM